MNNLHRLFYALALPLLLAACGGGGGGGSSGSGGSSGGSVSSGVTLGALASAAAGFNQTVALQTAVAGASTSYIWGENIWGQIGDGTLSTPKATPLVINVTGASGATWKAVAAGGYHTVAIKSDGSLWAWGLNQNGQSAGPGSFRTTPVQIGTAKDWLAVAAGEWHSVAIEGTTASNKIMTWGQGAAGQLGLATTSGTAVLADASAPTQVTKIYDIGGGVGTLVSQPVAGKTWKAVAAGSKHSMALRSDGQVYTWGSDTFGQLGQLASLNVSLPTNVVVLGAATNALAIAAGYNHSLAIQTDHSLWTWGDNASGQMGVTAAMASSAVGVQVGVTADWKEVAGGGAHSLGIKLDRTLWAWGSNTYGQLGDGTTTDSLTPIQIGTATNWVAVSAGKYHSLALDTDGKLWIWGRNDVGQLGTGAVGTPVLVPTLHP